MSRDTVGARSAAWLISRPPVWGFRALRSRRGRRLLFWVVAIFVLFALSYNPN